MILKFACGSSLGVSILSLTVYFKSGKIEFGVTSIVMALFAILTVLLYNSKD